MTTQSLIDEAVSKLDEEISGVFFRLGDSGFRASPAMLPIKQREKNMKEFLDLFRLLASRIATATKEEQKKEVMLAVSSLSKDLDDHVFCIAESKGIDCPQEAHNEAINNALSAINKVFSPQKEEVHET